MEKIYQKGILAALVLVAVVFSGCVGYGSTGNTPSPAAPNSVSIQNFAFSPSTLTVKVGTVVTWTNLDSAPHTVVSDSGSELSSDTLSNGQTYSHTFSTPGTYTYHCGVHTSMKGTVVVE
jgi:amicyanin